MAKLLAVECGVDESGPVESDADELLKRGAGASTDVCLRVPVASTVTVKFIRHSLAAMSTDHAVLNLAGRGLPCALDSKISNM